MLMTLDQGIAAVIAAVIVTAVGFFAGMITSRQKSDELLLLAINHLCGGTQERNVGISAIELYWNKKRHRQLCISMLVGSAIYLLRESKQKDAQHELYNLNRIMDFLLAKKKSFSASHPVLVYYKQLDGAIVDALADMESNKIKENGNKQNVKYETVSDRLGLWVNKDQLQIWHEQLNQVYTVEIPKNGISASVINTNPLSEKSILEKHSARIASLQKGLNYSPKLFTISKSDSKEEILNTDQNAWWYCLEGNGSLTTEFNNVKQNYILRANAMIPVIKGTKLIFQNPNQTPLQLIVFN